MVTCLEHAHHTASLLLPSSQLDVWDPISWMFATQIFKVIGHFKLRNFWQLLQKLVEKAVEFNSSQLIFRQEFLKYVLEILLLKTSFFDKNFRSEFRIDHSLKNSIHSSNSEDKFEICIETSIDLKNPSQSNVCFNTEGGLNFQSNIFWE